MQAQPHSSTIGSMFVHPTIHLENRRWQVLTMANHFGHRDTDGIVVDLFWNRRNLKDEFQVQAIRAFYHPFAAGRPFFNG
jgi:hypothetical protein